ncbi:hypothetical protein P8452_07342 [Trifolium repens]|nr:hypothetical protein P8452_07342 [Trifolium repens]
MTTTLRCLFSILFLSLVIKGSDARCSIYDLVVGTIRSGYDVKGVPEWNVIVQNNCNCSQSHIVLSCPGFTSEEPVDPSIFLVRYNTCLLIRGGTLAPHADVKFSYARDPPILIRPMSSVGSC